MSKRIFKYALAVEDDQYVNLPKGAEILHVGVQRDEPFLWALVDDSQPTEMVLILTVGTGHATDAKAGNYIGTYMLLNGALVFHVFTS